MNHEHRCLRCGKSYRHEGSPGSCKAPYDRRCDDCWQINRLGVCHPKWSAPVREMPGEVRELRPRRDGSADHGPATCGA